ncbi:hypothetical protein B0H19DRAFT_930106, partial [Mycena capillaripes]
CANLLTTSSNTWPKSALLQILASGVHLSKLVIGKPATIDAASNGFIATSTLATCIAQAKIFMSKHFKMSVNLILRYPGAAAARIQAVRTQSFPV